MWENSDIMQTSRANQCGGRWMWSIGYRALSSKGNTMSQPEFPTELTFRPRPTTSVMLNVPTDTLESLEQVAVSRDMSVEALLKLYIGQGLRQDVAQRFADRVLDLTAQVLARHGQSQEQVDAILREIRSATGT
jgi:hypothetical protein